LSNFSFLEVIDVWLDFIVMVISELPPHVLDLPPHFLELPQQITDLPPHISDLVELEASLATAEAEVWAVAKADQYIRGKK
jgi:hypothetical protein